MDAGLEGAPRGTGGELPGEGPKDPFGLTGRRGLVTGGSRGVGRAVAEALVEAGLRVGVTYRSREREAEATLDRLAATGAECWGFKGDLSDPDVVADLARRVEERGGLDVLVLNHGVWETRDIPLWEMSVEQWRHTLATNLESVFLVLRSLLPLLREDGSVVVVTSTAAQRGEAYHSDYAASKGALQSLVKGLALEVASRGIRVNGVAPGWVRTEMVAPVLTGEGLDRILAGIPLGRVAEPEDVAGPVLFLASALSRHVTGEILNVNGGAVRPG